MITVSGILLVDDDPEDQAILADALDALNSTNPLHLESNGADALRRLDAMFSDSRSPCLLVIDLNMPRIGGTEVLAAVKSDERFRQIPVIIYTTSVNKSEKENCLRLGAHSYLTKPLSYQESLQTAKLFLQLCESMNVGTGS